MRFAVLMAACLAVSGCSAVKSVANDVGQALPALTDPAADVPAMVAESYNYKVLRGYEWKRSLYADEKALNIAIDQAVTREMAALPPVESVGAAVRVLRPNPRTVSGVAAIANLRLAEARFEALRASGLFTSLRVENNAPGKFVTKGRDYVLQYDQGAWILKDAEDRQVTVGHGGTLAGFVANVAAAVRTLRGDFDYIQVLQYVQGTGMPDVITYRDGKYTTLAPLVDAFDRVNAELASQVVASAKPLGGRALLVVPRHAPDKALLRPGERPGLIDSARKAYRQALDRRFARFVMAAKLFAEVKVVHADDVGPIPLDYDWVLWRRPNDSQWSGRSRDDDFGALALSTQPAGFAQGLAEALTWPPDPLLDLPEPAVTPVPDTVPPRHYVR